MAAEESEGTKSADHQIPPATPAADEVKSFPLPDPSLTGEECGRLQRLGLGIAVNITEKHSWGKKSAFQAKEVKGTKDLIVINESNQFKKYLEVVESYSEVQAALESSFRPSPNVPIDVSIAADFHRSFRNKKSINGKILLTRTVAFRMNSPTTRAAEKEEFEVQLNEWLEKSKSIQKGNVDTIGDTILPEECRIPNYKPKSVHQPSDTSTPANDSEEESWYYRPETNHSCIGYLRALGGVTHYVSSITLGASEYNVETEKLLNLSLSQSTGAHVDRFATARVKSSKKKKQFVSRSKTEAIGRVPTLDKGKPKDTLPFRSENEAVVRCSFTSLSDLVTHAYLQKQLEAAIQEYIDCQLHGTRGPYHIATAEELEEEGTSLRGRLYWKVKVDDHTLPPSYHITYTLDPEEASNFYLKPFEVKYFLIATDPEDPRTANQLKKKSSATTSQPATHPGVSHTPNQPTMENQPTAADTDDPHTPNQPKMADQSKVKDQHTPNYTRAPQRFVHMNPKDKLPSVKMVIDKKKAAFKLKDAHSKLSHSLSKSQWLPEAALGSQPYFIQLRGPSYRHKLLLTMPEEQPRTNMPERQPRTDRPERQPRTDRPERQPCSEGQPRTDIPERQPRSEGQPRTDIPERQPHAKHVTAHRPHERLFHRQLFILEPGHPT